jgi:hypothetical protein
MLSRYVRRFKNLRRFFQLRRNINKHRCRTSFCWRNQVDGISVHGTLCLWRRVEGCFGGNFLCNSVKLSQYSPAENREISDRQACNCDFMEIPRVSMGRFLRLLKWNNGGKQDVCVDLLGGSWIPSGWFTFSFWSLRVEELKAILCLEISLIEVKD